MRRRISSVALATVLLVASFPLVGMGSPPDTAVYVSLGTSLAAGSQIDAGGNTTFGSDQSYPDQLYQRVKGRIATDLVHEKLGCPGETTDQFLGGVNAFGQPSNCAGLYDTGSQLGDALAAIAEDNVVLVTMDIGANDITQAQTVCQGDPGCIVGKVPLIIQNVVQILATVRGAGYDGPIVAMNYYNPQAAAAIGFFPGVAGQQTPDLSAAQLSDQLVQAFNGALGQVYGAFGVQVADVYAAFNAGDFGDDRPANGTPDNLDVLCALSYMCPDDPGVKANIHLNNKGYKVVAKTFLGVISRIDFDK